MSRSLRLRMFLIILLPLILLALAVGVWRLFDAKRTAEELFDKDLLFVALAVSRDVALSDGDALSAETWQLLGDAAGGPVRYHVYAPDGAFVTGYAVPPVPITRKLPENLAHAYFDASYKGSPARVLRLKDETSFSGMTGTFTITVWQDLSARNAFVAQLALRTMAIILIMLLAASFLVWFGVRFGLKPLLDLEEAISRRSSEDLSPIRRAVPVETTGIVRRLNNLFAQVSSTIEAQANFASDAAHQLRNPISGLRALAEATTTAPDLETARRRAGELTRASSETAALAERLLTLDRAESGKAQLEDLDLTRLLSETATAILRGKEDSGVELVARLPERAVVVNGDGVMLREALSNLIDNAYVHGGPSLSRIEIMLDRRGADCRVTISDDGRGVADEDIPKILARFGQGRTGQGSGLGLSIAEVVAKRHGGHLDVLSEGNGFSVRFVLPGLRSRPAA